MLYKKFFLILISLLGLAILLATPALADIQAQDHQVSCYAILLAGESTGDGVYTIDPDGAGPETPVDVYCDMTTDGGGWTLVGSSLNSTFNDQGSVYYTDLITLTPAASHEGIWEGLRPVAASDFSDIRFSCRAQAAPGPFDVDLAFYQIDWYDEITSSADDAAVCFEESNGDGQTLPPPARQNLLTGETRPLGDQWDYGYLEGEDSCSDTSDFTVDFDDRGMDNFENDGTDWGEDDGSQKCGLTSTSEGAWFVWVREPFGVYIDPASAQSSAFPGETVILTFTLTNLTGVDDSFDLAVQDNTWTAALSVANTGLLPHGGMYSFTVTVDVPLDAAIGSFDDMVVQVASDTDPANLNTTADLRLYARSGQDGYIFTPNDESIKVVDTAGHFDTGIVIDTSAYGSWPWRGALSPDGNWLYASLREANTILGIDTASNTIAFSLTVGSQPHGIAFTSDGAYALVANHDDDSVSVIDTSVPTVTATIPVGDAPYSIAVIPCANKAYVTTREDGSISVIDLNTFTVTQVISGVESPWDIVVSPYGHRAFVSGYGMGAAIDTIHDTLIITSPLGGENLAGMDISPDGKFIYVAGAGSGQTYVVNAHTGEILNWMDTSNSQAWEVEFFPPGAGSLAYVTSVEDNTVQVIDTLNHTILSEIPLSGEPRGLALFPPETTCLSGVVFEPGFEFKAATPGETITFTQLLFNLTGAPASFNLFTTSDPWTTTLSANNTGVLPYGGRFAVEVSVEVPASAQVADFQHDLLTAISVLNPTDTAQARLSTVVPRPGYIFNTDEDQIHVIDTRFHFDTGIVITAPEDSFPWRGALSPDGSQLYVSLRDDDAVMVVDTGNLSGPHPTVPVGNITAPQGIAFSPDGAQAYLALTDNDTVAVLDTQNLTVTAVIPVMDEPFNVATSPCLPDKVYVTSRDGYALSVIDATTLTVTQVITGLEGAWDVVISPLGDRAYVSNAYTGTIAVIDTASDTLLETWLINRDAQLQGMDLAPSGKILYATDNVYGLTYVIDTATGEVLEEIRTGPYGSAWEVETFAWPYGHTAYVTGAWDRMVAIIDTQTNLVKGTLGFNGYVRGLALFPPEAACSVPPTAAFTPTVSSIEAGSTITFTNLSSGFPEPIYLWNFGDGGFSLQTHPIHTFDTPGEYTVILTATNPIDQSAAYGIITVKSIYQQIFLPTLLRH